MHPEYAEAQSVRPRFMGSESVDAGLTPLALAEAGALLMARFRNRLESMERELKRPLPHRFWLTMDGNTLTSHSEIF